jgi:osmotically-inducible protein OsmY
MPAASVLTDSEVKRDVLDQLRRDPRIQETEVGVQVRSGVVTLTGVVSDYQKKLAARDAAHRVMGVLDLIDNTTVRQGAPEYTDEDIARAIRRTLEWDPRIPDADITTTVSRGVVTLAGQVDCVYLRDHVRQIVEGIRGITDVVDVVTVRPPAAGTNFLRDEIEGASGGKRSRRSCHA